MSTLTPTLIQADALKWLANQKPNSISNIVTGIPDLDEVKMTLPAYQKFFTRAVQLCLSRTHPEGYTIFCQTDRKYNRTWIDKSYWINQVAARLKHKLCWHKIVLLRDPGKTNLYRPTYSHLMCFSRKGTTGAAMPDVLPPSKQLYANGTPVNAVHTALKFIKKNSAAPLVVDPFVGRGTIPCLARQYKLPSIGIDLDPKQIRAARKLIDRAT